MYLIDIDGTLTQGDTFPPTGKETINHTMVQKVAQLRAQGGHIYILTGRPNKYRDLTERWLRNNNIKYDKLIMNNTDKRSNDFKKDTVARMSGIDRWYDNNSGIEKIAQEMNIKFTRV